MELDDVEDRGFKKDERDLFAASDYLGQGTSLLLPWQSLPNGLCLDYGRTSHLCDKGGPRAPLRLGNSSIQLLFCA
jgi:hypothetical protein